MTTSVPMPTPMTTTAPPARNFLFMANHRSSVRCGPGCASTPERWLTRRAGEFVGDSRSVPPESRCDMYVLRHQPCTAGRRADPGEVSAVTIRKQTRAVLAVGVAALFVAATTVSGQLVIAEPAAVTGSTHPVDPARLVETRNGPADTTSDGQLQAIGTRPTDSVLTVPVLGRGGIPATGVGAVMLNVTAVNPTAPGYLTVYPCGTTPPKASNVNYTTGQVIP